MVREQRNHKDFLAKSPPGNPRFAFRKHMIINREFEQLLQRNGLDSFNAIMDIKGGEVVKQQLKERRTVKLQLGDGENKVILYLKRYCFPTVSTFAKNCFKLARTYSAVHEWRNILALQRCSIPTMTPVAVGMRHRKLFLNESFLLTLGIPCTNTLEHLAETYFAPPLDRVRVEKKRALITRVASLARKIHQQAFKHQDFYLCHILVNWNDPENPLLYIADLHRLKRQNKSKSHWKIKDLAALNFSASEKIITRTDRLRFLKEYDPVLSQDHLFVRAVVKKTERIRKHAAGKRC